MAKKLKPSFLAKNVLQKYKSANRNLIRVHRRPTERLITTIKKIERISSSTSSLSRNAHDSSHTNLRKIIINKRACRTQTSSPCKLNTRDSHKSLSALKMSRKRARLNTEQRMRLKVKSHKSILTGEATLTVADQNNLEGELISNLEIMEEFHRNNLAALKHSKYQPEHFLKPPSKPDLHHLDRDIDTRKLYSYLVTFMEKYYDLRESSQAGASWRLALDERLWDKLAYAIPVLCRQVIREQLENENIILTTEPDCLVFGDIHGNWNDIYVIWKRFISNHKYAHHKFIFLGDYVDRGPRSLEVVVFLLCLKLMDPKRFLLLRGNHEVTKVNKKYGFKCFVEKIYADTGIKHKVFKNYIYKSINQVFEHLPLAAVIRFRNSKGIFCCHGGIPNESYNNNKPWTVEQLNKLTFSFKPHDLCPRKNCPQEQLALNEILWNDPYKSSSSSLDNLFVRNIKRGGHCSKFSEKAVDRFLGVNHLRLVIRGHQFKCSKEKGYCYNYPGHQVLTVFSSSNYCGVEHNTTGLVMVTEAVCEPAILRTVEESKPYQDFNTFVLIHDPNTKEVVNIKF